MISGSYESRSDCLVRPRINALLSEAIKHPLTIVLAGAGYGKTLAVSEFTRRCSLPSVWLQFSEQDNAGSRFWAKYVQILASWDESFSEQCRLHGFPDTEDKLNRFYDMCVLYEPDQQFIMVLDDVHLITHPDILRFIERRLHMAMRNISAILICREMPALNLTRLQMRGFIPVIGEDELRFTENELALYFAAQGLTVPKQSLRDILSDTKGWVFPVNMIAHSLKKSPGYSGYVRTAMKQSIFSLMGTEVFDVISEPLKRFLVRLSLVDHLSADLIAALAREKEELIQELRRQSAYIRFDSGTNAYHIHHLFLDYLRIRQHDLTPDEVRETYTVAADWCCQNGFEADALGYWEKTRDYESIASLLARLPIQMPPDIALRAGDILARVPIECFGKNELLAVMHVRICIRLGRFGDALKLLLQYEELFLSMPEDDRFRNVALGFLYHTWGGLRALLGTVDSRYDFDFFYGKMADCLTGMRVELDHYIDMPIGFWASLVGSSRRDAPLAYIEAAARTVKHTARCGCGGFAGLDPLCRGELLFYQGNARAAKPLFINLLEGAYESRQFEIEHKAMFYLMRLALARGDMKEAGQILNEMGQKIENKEYTHIQLNYDAAMGWYFCALRQPDSVPAWLREKFAPYAHAYYIENVGNQIKARYHYLTRNYLPLLAYIEGIKRREAILYGRVEMLALEACAHFQMKEPKEAFAALEEAYQCAAPNGILMPFIELGKDMRTLVSAALREPGVMLPSEWLEMVKRRSASFAKYQSSMVFSYEEAHLHDQKVALTVREREILSDLYHGLSRAEIAATHALSTNTVNSAISNVFNKLGARSVTDAVRIAAEKRLV